MAQEESNGDVDAGMRPLTDEEKAVQRVQGNLLYEDLKALLKIAPGTPFTTLQDAVAQLVPFHVFGSDLDTGDPSSTDPVVRDPSGDEAFLAEIDALAAEVAGVEADLAAQQQRGTVSATDKLGWAHYLATEAAPRPVPQAPPQPQLGAAGRAVSSGAAAGVRAAPQLAIRPQLSLQGAPSVLQMPAAALLQSGLSLPGPLGAAGAGPSVASQLAAARAATQQHQQVTPQQLQQQLFLQKQQQMLQQQQQLQQQRPMLPGIGGPGAPTNITPQQAAFLLMQQRVQMQQLQQQQQQQQQPKQ